VGWGGKMMRFISISDFIDSSTLNIDYSLISSTTTAATTTTRIFKLAIKYHIFEDALSNPSGDSLSLNHHGT
jgi:hypothetical protein